MKKALRIVGACVRMMRRDGASARAEDKGSLDCMVRLGAGEGLKSRSTVSFIEVESD